MNITEVFQKVFQFDPQLALLQLVTLGLAFVIALPVAWNREFANRIAGLRTFPLVALAAAAYVLIAREALESDTGTGHQNIIQGLMTGLGFLGAGAILKSGDKVRGMVTATALWTTAAIGAAVAYGQLEVAILLSAVIFGSLRALRPVKSYLHRGDVRSAGAVWNRRSAERPRHRRARAQGEAQRSAEPQCASAGSSTLPRHTR